MTKVFTNSGEATLIADAQNTIVAANAAFTKLTGYTAKELLGKDPKILSPGKKPRRFIRKCGYPSPGGMALSIDDFDGAITEQSAIPKLLR